MEQSDGSVRDTVGDRAGQEPRISCLQSGRTGLFLGDLVCVSLAHGDVIESSDLSSRPVLRFVGLF